jgi:hypothetical protein
MFVKLGRSWFPQTLRAEVGNLALFIVASNDLARKRLAYANTRAVLRVTMASSGKEEILRKCPYLVSYCITPITSLHLIKYS